MKTKEAIEWLSHSLVMNNEKADATIKLLQQGEKAKEENVILKKYKQMWKEFKEKLSKGSVIFVNYIIRDLEQKYFPEEYNIKLKKKIAGKHAIKEEKKKGLLD